MPSLYVFALSGAVPSVHVTCWGPPRKMFFEQLILKLVSYRSFKSQIVYFIFMKIWTVLYLHTGSRFVECTLFFLLGLFTSASSWWIARYMQSLHSSAIWGLLSIRQPEMALRTTFTVVLAMGMNAAEGTRKRCYGTALKARSGEGAKGG